MVLFSRALKEHITTIIKLLTVTSANALQVKRPSLKCIAIEQVGDITKKKKHEVREYFICYICQIGNAPTINFEQNLDLN